MLLNPFMKHFEEVEIGETLITHKHTVTDADIINFANVSGDHFYAHTDTTSLDGTYSKVVLRMVTGFFLKLRECS